MKTAMRKQSTVNDLLNHKIDTVTEIRKIEATQRAGNNDQFITDLITEPPFVLGMPIETRGTEAVDNNGQPVNVFSTTSGTNRNTGEIYISAAVGHFFRANYVAEHDFDGLIFWNEASGKLFDNFTFPSSLDRDEKVVIRPFVSLPSENLSQVCGIIKPEGESPGYLGVSADFYLTAQSFENSNWIQKTIHKSFLRRSLSNGLDTTDEFQSQFQCPLEVFLPKGTSGIAIKMTAVVRAYSQYISPGQATYALIDFRQRGSAFHVIEETDGHTLNYPGAIGGIKVDKVRYEFYENPATTPPIII